MQLTLDYFKSHPLRLAKDQSNMLIATVRHHEDNGIHEDDMHPSMGAFVHYGGVELADMLTITKPDLSQDQIKELAYLWNQSCGQVARQLLFYTWQIIFREMRHGSIMMTAKAFNGQNIDPDYVKCISQITSSSAGYMEAVDGIGHRSVGPLVAAIERHYRHGGWVGSFGGVKWADIAKVIVRYFYGDMSAMLAADRAWTLVHNTGPIFNKGFYFKFHDGMLMNILNAQAKSSVFDVQDKLVGNSEYAHPCFNAFLDFQELAVSAIKTVKPDYEPGSTGSVNSDGSKPSDPEPETKHEKLATKQKTIGPYAVSAILNERIEQ